MGYNNSPIDTKAYSSAPDGNLVRYYQGVDRMWYDVRAYQRGGAAEATSSMKAQWQKEAEEAQRKAAADELAATNAQKEQQMQSLLKIQQEAMAEQQRQEQSRQQEEQAAIERERQVEADRVARLNQDALTAANQKTDLLSENLPNVVAGGSADQFASAASDQKKKRGAGLSTSLGINV